VDKKVLYRVFEVLRQNPSYVEVFERILEWYDEEFKCSKCGSSRLKRGKRKFIYVCEDCGAENIVIGFHTMEVGVPPTSLTSLVYKGILIVTDRTAHGGTRYLLKDKEAVVKALEEWKRGFTTAGEEIEIPGDIFSIIHGFDDIKKLILRSLKSNNPVHILLVGPPGSAKSLFLYELNRIPGSYFMVAGTSTKAGIRDILLEFMPRILLIDELDKITNPMELSVLLTWMETGKVVVTTHTMKRESVGKGWLFAACNSTKRFPPELLSRFLVLRIPPYTDEEFVGVVKKVLTEREGKTPELADYIAKKVLSMGSRDPRDAIKIARLCNTKEDVDEVVQIMKKYGRKPLI